MRKSFEYEITRIVFVSLVIHFLVLAVLLSFSELSIWMVFLVLALSFILVLYSCAKVFHTITFQLRSLSNLFEAILGGDYSLRARTDRHDGAIDELINAINGLAGKMSQQRQETVESQLLLETVVTHIDVAVLAFRDDSTISFANPAAKQLLGITNDALPESVLNEFSFIHHQEQGYKDVLDLNFIKKQGRFRVYLDVFRNAGVQQKILFITDVGHLLRKEEKKAWQSIVRVISHEINNSLTPLISISQTLTTLLTRDDEKNYISCELKNSLEEGLSIITSRSSALKFFIDSYKELSKFRTPSKVDFNIFNLIQRVKFLFKENKINIEGDVSQNIFADEIQIEQVIINLIKNAIEAADGKEKDNEITITWNVDNGFFNLKIADNGSGISNKENLFVPFYTTKPEGSGIGLILSRQIIEAHEGNLTLDNRCDNTGCIATIRIPLLFNSAT